MPTKNNDAELVVDRETGLPAGLSDLVVESQLEGFRFLHRLVRDWGSGRNRFDKKGEALFAARWQGRLVGVCGVNRDLFLNDDGVGRLRHLYVARDVRRQGIGQRLVATTLGHARKRFRRVRLRSDGASGFYHSIGFLGSREPDATHEVHP